MLLTLSESVLSQNSTPSAAVESFYRFTRTGSGIFNTKEVKSRSKWFTAELNSLFLNELKREAEYLKANPTNKPYFGDGFPVEPVDEPCDANGKQYLRKYAVKSKSTNGNAAQVEVKFFYPAQCNLETIVYLIYLKKSKTRWLINDLRYPDGGTLAADLRRKEY